MAFPAGGRAYGEFASCAPPAAAGRSVIVREKQIFSMRSDRIKAQESGIVSGRRLFC